MTDVLITRSWDTDMHRGKNMRGYREVSLYKQTGEEPEKSNPASTLVLDI